MRKPIDLEQGWDQIEEGIGEFIKFLEGETHKNETVNMNIGLYTLVYNMCTQKSPNDHSQQLYDRYKGTYLKYISASVAPSLRNTHDEFFLKKLVKRWKNHKLMVKWMRKIFNYLDRYYVIRYNLESLQEVGIHAFRDTIYEEMKEKARDAVLKQMEMDREGVIVDYDMLREVLSIFQEVGMGSIQYYERDFEQAMLKATGEYYQRCATAWIQEDSTPDYLKKAEARLLEEEARVDKYLHVEGKANLLKEADNKLLDQHLNVLLEKEDSGFNALLSDDRLEDISRMYRLFSRLPHGLDPVASLFKQYIEEEGMNLVRKLSESARQKMAEGSKEGPSGVTDHSFVQGTIALQDRYSGIVSNCFDSSPLFHKAMKEAFESFCNKSISGASVPELMSSFGDAILRKGGASRLVEDDLDIVLDKLVKLLAYISDRDMFSEFYRKKLARRLLHATSCGEDTEKGVLTRLKQQCGQQFTSKMEGMVQDLQMAREKERNFRNWLEERNITLPLDMNVTVLTTGYWPSYKTLEMELPDGMVTGLQHFSQFHDEAAPSRKLIWQLGLGSVHLKATFDKTYELVMAPVQAVVLLCFNDDDASEEMNFADLKDNTKLPEEDLSRALHSLCLAKYKILLKASPEKKISKTDVFRLNKKFSDRARRIRIPLPAVDDRRKVQEEVDKDRRHTVDAAIVRIMKSRKTLSHSDLMLEVVQQLQKMFQPDIKVIKRSIEGLIERDYLERDTDNQQVYKYVA